MGALISTFHDLMMSRMSAIPQPPRQLIMTFEPGRRFVSRTSGVAADHALPGTTHAATTAWISDRRPRCGGCRGCPPVGTAQSRHASSRLRLVIASACGRSLSSASLFVIHFSRRCQLTPSASARSCGCDHRATRASRPAHLTAAAAATLRRCADCFIGSSSSALKQRPTAKKNIASHSSFLLSCSRCDSK